VLPPVERGKRRLKKAEEWVDEEERKFLELVGEPLIKVEHHHPGKDNWNEDSDSPVHSQGKRAPTFVNKRSEDDFNELLKTSPKKKRKNGGHARDEQWEQLEAEADRSRHT